MVRQQKKTAADIFDAAELNGARPVEETDINDDPVPSVIQPGTEINYDRMLNLWDEYVHSPSMPQREHILSFPFCGTGIKKDIQGRALTVCRH